MAELPYMKLWWQRFFGSVRVQALRGRERLLYLGLLVAEWGMDGDGLPTDRDELARILGLTRGELDEDGRPLGEFFYERDGRLWNDTCEEIREEELTVARKNSEHGKRGAEKRWGKNGKKDGKKEAAASACPGIARAMASRAGGGDGSSSSKAQEGEKTQEDQKTQAMGGAGGLGEGAEVLEAYSFEFGLGTPKAARAIDRLRPTLSHVEAWRAERGRMTKRRFLWAIQRFVSPEALAADDRRFREEEKRDLSRIEDPDERTAAVLRRYPRPRKSALSDLAPLHEYVAKRSGNGNGNGKEHA